MDGDAMNAHSRDIPLYLTKKELDRLIEKLPRKRHQLGCALMAYAGLRVSEMNSIMEPKIKTTTYV
jgi:integrase